MLLAERGQKPLIMGEVRGRQGNHSVKSKK